MCLPVKSLAGSQDTYSISEQELNSKYDYFGTLVALGNLRFSNPTSSQLGTAVKLLSNVSKIVKTAGPAFTSLSGSVSDDDVASEALK